MRKTSNWITILIVGLALIAAGTAWATNGYFTHGTGTKNKSMAGAGIALPEDAIDVANNPAVASFVGDQVIVGAALFSPVRKYETYCTQPPLCADGNFGAFTIGPNRLTSDSEYYVIPHIAWSRQLNNGNAFALAFYGRGGMNTDWKGGTATFDHDRDGVPSTFPGTYGFGTAGVDLSQALLDITWSKQINEKLSLGVSAVLALQWFEAEGVMNFAPFTETFAASGGMEFPQNLSNNGHEYSYGAGLKLGLHAPVSDRISLGLMYQTKLSMSEFDDYADLFAEQGDFDIPANLKAGITFHAGQKTDISFDIEHTWFSDVDAVGNPIQNLFACPTLNPQSTAFENCLGGDNGGGFGWDDMTTLKLGLRYRAGEDWTWRFGYSYGEQPISGGQDPQLSQMTFNILAPATIEQHITAGFTLERTKGRQFNMTAMFAPNTSERGVQNFDPTQTVKFEMYQWELEASYSWRF